MNKNLKKFAMYNFVACAATNRPEYCQFETNVCCFSCELNDECMAFVKSKTRRRMLPCTVSIFDEEEVCEFAL